jgi:glycosyltransferase involved in cell wall biosynthesis
MVQAVAPARSASRPARGRPEVSIVMPCLNEEEGITHCIRQAQSFLARSGKRGEIIVVDNGSTDKSVALAIEAGARVVQEERRGYGHALCRGISEAQGDVIVMGDCDGTYDFEHLDSLLAPLNDGYDISIGNRYAGGIEAGAMPWSHRMLGTPAISLLLQVFAGVKHGDSQCGLRAFTREAVEVMQLNAGGMEFASEMLLKASRRGLTIAEVPITYSVRLGEAKLETVRDGWRHLRFLLLATPNYLFTVPGLVLTLAGVAVLVLSLFNTGTIGNWRPVFAGTIFLVVGLNAVLLGFASRLFTTAKGITNEDWFVRFYRRHLSLEIFIAAAVLLMGVGIAVDIFLAFEPAGQEGVPDRLSLMALAQALIIVGANLGLVGALGTMLEAELD